MIIILKHFRLLSYLKEPYSARNPNIAVGHGGPFGQRWVDNQEHILQAFRNNECTLLISTTVLEEGIDVPDCNLVIRFGGSLNLITYIQSRGRARDDNGRFVIIVSDEESKYFEQIEIQEKVMEHALSEHDKRNIVFDSNSEHFFSNLLAGEKEIELQRCIDDTCELSDTVVQIFICGDTGKQINGAEIKEELMSTLGNFGFEVQRIETQRKNSATELCPEMFQAKDIRILLQLNKDSDQSLQQILTSWLTAWNFRLGNADCASFALISLDKPVADVNQNEFEVCSLGAGEFLNMQAFAKRYEHKLPGQAKLKFTLGKIIKISYDTDESYELKVSLLKTTTGGFALTSWSNDRVTLFIPIETMPAMYKKSERVTAHQCLENLAKYKVLAFEIKITSKGTWNNLLEIFNDDSLCPLHVFASRILIVDNGVDSVESISKENLKNAKANKALLQDEWAVYEKFSDMKMHPSVSEVNTLLLQIRTAHEKENTSLARQISTAIRLSSRVGRTYWDSFEEIVQSELESIQRIDKNNDFVDFIQQIAPDQCSMLRLVVTPTRYVFPSSVPMRSSRLSRMLEKVDNSLVIVSFRDENLDKIENDQNIHTKVKDCIENGITLFGRQFRYLCSSASQLREQGAFFIDLDSQDRIDAIRKQMILDPKEFKVNAKYLSRLGLFATADLNAGHLEWDLCQEIPDIKAINGNLVTDGAGYIEETLAKILLHAVGHKTSTSVLQFRYAGLKGVLVILPASSHVFAKYPGKKLLYRPSQQKFKTDPQSDLHSEFGIVRTGNAHNVKLNREIITLLEGLSMKGVEWMFAKHLVEAQDKYLDEAYCMLKDNSAAVNELLKHLPFDMIDKVSLNFNIRLEPFFFRLLRCAYKIIVYDLCKRANLWVQDASLVIGIPDYSNQLKDNEIFLMVSKDGEEDKVIKGPAIIYRNPCLHPGDVQRVNAVDVPELRITKNVVVLPAFNSSSSLSAHCSGGDLDGDQFSVIWNKNFVPPDDLFEDPLDYEDLDADPPMKVDDVTDPNETSKFYVSCMENDALGRVAHMHLALCDLKEKGAVDPVCKSLAESQAIAVDYPKTGQRPKVPQEALETVKKIGYPDFMEKKGGTSYVSKRVQGDLYRNCKSFLFGFDLKERLQRKIPFDSSLKMNLPETTLNEAGNLYKHYIVAMRKLMNQFALNEEEEVILGRPVLWHKLLASDRDKASTYLKEAYKQIKDKFKKLIKIRVQKHEPDHFVLACYKVAYDQDTYYDLRPFLSFPWIVFEELCLVKHKKSVLPTILDTEIEEGFGRSSIDFVTAEVKILISCLTKKQLVLKSIQETIDKEVHPDHYLLKAYGSTSMYLCEEHSDLDICIEILSPAQAAIQDFAELDELKIFRHCLRNHISQAVDSIFKEKTDLINNDVPLIKGKFQDFQIDLSCNLDGLLKTKYFLALYKSDLAYFMSILIIMKWSRWSGLVKCQYFGSHTTMETAVMYAFIIELLQTKKMDIDNHSQDELVDNLNLLKDNLEEKKDDKELHVKIGGHIHKFFRRATSLKESDMVLNWPVEGLPAVPVTKDIVCALKNASKRALHVIFNTRDVEELLNNTRDSTQMYESSEPKKLSLRLSRALIQGRSFHESRLSTTSEAEVSLSVRN